VSEWQPIVTAPMDGTWVMLYEPCAEFPTKDFTHWLAMWSETERMWMDQDDAQVVRAPTHWMPLPEPPK
jgi:hypothetical protein